MLPLEAHVKNGRLVLDPTTDLPEGAEIELVVVDGELAPEERARLLETIEAGASDIASGDYVDGTDFANPLLARREAACR